MADRPEEALEALRKQFDTISTKIDQQHNRPKRRELPTFTGEKHHNAVAWLETAEKLRLFNNVSSETVEDQIPPAVLWMGVAFEGPAHTWYSTLEEKTKLKYDLFLRAFRKMFVRATPETHLANYHKRIQRTTETISEYFLALQQLIKDSGYEL